MPFSYIGTRDAKQWDRRRGLFVPSTYTRTPTSTAEAEDQLAAHLNGIDTELGALSGGKVGDAYTEVNADATTATAVGFDTLDLFGGTGISTAAAGTGTVTITNTAPFVLHAATHIRGGGDQVDGDLIDIDYSPTNYTPTPGANGTTNNEELTSHLTGIDTSLGTKRTNAYTQFTGDSGSDTAVNADTMAFVGAGMVTTAVTAGTVTITANGLMSRWATGKRYFTSALTGSTTTTFAPLTGSIRYTQIFIPDTYQLGFISAHLVAGAGLGRTLRLAIYEDVDGIPVNLLIDTGTISAASTAVKRTSVSALTTGPGYVWLAMQVSNDALTFRAAPQDQIGPYLGEKDDTVAFAQGITHRVESPFAYAAFPATASATLTDTTGSIVLIGLSRT